MLSLSATLKRSSITWKILPDMTLHLTPSQGSSMLIPGDGVSTLRQFRTWAEDREKILFSSLVGDPSKLEDSQQAYTSFQLYLSSSPQPFPGTTFFDGVFLSQLEDWTNQDESGSVWDPNKFAGDFYMAVEVDEDLIEVAKEKLELTLGDSLKVYQNNGKLYAGFYKGAAEGFMPPLSMSKLSLPEFNYQLNPRKEESLKADISCRPRMPAVTAALHEMRFGSGRKNQPRKSPASGAFKVGDGDDLLPRMRGHYQNLSFSAMRTDVPNDVQIKKASGSYGSIERTRLLDTLDNMLVGKDGAKVGSILFANVRSSSVAAYYLNVLISRYRIDENGNLQKVGKVVEY